MPEHPNIWLLNMNRHWQAFGSFTFKRVPPQQLRISLWHDYVRVVADRYSVRSSRIVWGLREELGEIGGRPHFHALLDGLPEHGVSQTEVLFKMEQLWKKYVDRCCGFAEVHRYDRSLHGLEYILKCLRVGITPAQAYEDRKFGRDTIRLYESKSYTRLRQSWASKDIYRMRRLRNLTRVKQSVYAGSETAICNSRTESCGTEKLQSRVGEVGLLDEPEHCLSMPL